MPRKQQNKNVVKWLSEEIIDENRLSTFFKSYEKFQFRNIIAGVDDFVLVSNADAAEPDTEEGCDAARILSLYEDLSSQSDPCRAKVQWYSRPGDIPKRCFQNIDGVNFLEKEVVEDHRPFDTDVSIETFFKKCHITLTLTKDTDHFKNEPYHYICRYRLMPVTKRKFGIEPVLEQERKAMELLGTPNKNMISSPKPRTPKTPSSLIDSLNKISVSEQKKWSVSKNDGTKLLLKRAILTDKLEKNSPKKVNDSHYTTTYDTSKKKINKSNIEDMLDMELLENSDDELPTLVIRKPSIKIEANQTPIRKSISKTSKNGSPNKKVEFVPLKLKVTSYDELPTLVLKEKITSPKKKQSLFQTNDGTPKKVLVFETNDKTPSRTRKSIANDTKAETPKRSCRSTRAAVSYIEQESPVKRTPKKTVRKIDDSDDDDFAPLARTLKTPRTPVISAKTPRTPATPKTPRSTRTPKSVTRRILTCQLTPSLHSRAHSVENINEYMKENGSLPGREDQMDEILSFVRNKLLENTSGCMYISGVPGTGKTATVCSALNILKQEADLPEFQLVEVNGMRIAEPRQAYVQIYKQLTGKSVVWEQACTLLEKRFTNPGPRRTPTVLLVDELDALCTRRQDVLYSIMEWTTHSSALLTVLAVANTMDLPERALASRVASRLGLTRLTFPPYTHSQLQTIVSTRLVNANVTSDAVQLIARKVAAVSGDARRALALCSRALELAGPEGAGLKEVQQALAEAASSAAVRSIKNCSQSERLLLRAIAAEVERTGTDETTLSRALHTAAAIVALDGRPYRAAPSVRPPTPAQALAICARLAACRLVLLEYKAEPRLLLNVSTDDVHYATKEICV